MRKFVLTAIAAFLLGWFNFGGIAEAGQSQKKCAGGNTACDIYKRQMTAPRLTGPKAPSEPVRCVAVLSDQESALALRKGPGNNGRTITSWRLATLDWRETNRGFETTVCFPKRYVREFDALTLCGAVGHSEWHEAEMAYLQSRNVGAGDPACVGGKRWCGKRGL